MIRVLWIPEGIESLTENIIKLDNYTSHLPHI